ncbi:MAG: hypothetical protein EO766_16820 [Hydrotalea sp. AMD]|uniref:DUF6680 family protein n=1 Tax=Hydrotalea TaxID=1004300 RepID=UPI0009420EEA|nr:MULTISPECIES: DUF6680 family protein [Hydrotalea]RWZ85454.1 MAG: hypothetical protein EO766_16820 [Hydrotalea sp. AMD]
METKDIIMTVAVLVGPIAAIQIQKWLDNRREIRGRKLNIFKTLMTTRATRVSLEHIQALNMIDIEFIGKKYQKVVQAWRQYHDMLSNSNPQAQDWSNRIDDLFINLLFEMGQVLGYSFDKVMLRRTAYSPIAHGDLEFDQQVIRKGLSNIMKGEAALPVYFVNGNNTETQE